MPSLHRHTSFLALLALLVASAGCDRHAPPSPLASSPPGSSSAAARSSAEVRSPAEPTAEERRCLDRLAHLASLEPLAGAPAFEARRAEILGRAKGEAVVFLRAPARAEGLDARLASLAARLEKEQPVMAVPGVWESLRPFPADARRVLLREGYVYAESPEMASVLVDVLKLGKLFRERELFLARGAETFRLERDGQGGYRFADGEQRGEEAFLLFGDRVATSERELSPALHRDLGRVVREHAPDRVSITRLTSEGAVAELRYGSHVVPAALADDGRQLSVECVAPSPSARVEVESLRAGNTARAEAIEPVRAAVRAMIGERLRFDEPLEEVGQQDGSLRPLWRWAYDHGGSGYKFNGVGYPVFDASGRPHPPQVCVDFVLDAFERGSGSWFRGRDEPRERVRGAVDFEAMDLRNRRSAAQVVSFAQAHPEMFDVWTLADEERVAFGRRGDFFAFLASHAERLHAGDVVVIHGMKDDGQAHYHSFLIDALDPITGVPYRLAGNAGRPRLQSWEGVMRTAPLRSIRHVISPRSGWLEAAMKPPKKSLATR